MMSNNHKEIESKFYVRNLDAIENQLQTLGAKCIVPRGFEYNLRYDDQQNNLQQSRKVLRLRKYDDIRLTFKGPGEKQGNAYSRTEIELIVNDFETAQKFLEHLGYHVSAIYEKFRAMYRLDTALITLDELPFGKFVEIEDESPEKIHDLACKLKLDPTRAIPASYQGLFEQLKQTKNLSMQNLAFVAFEDLSLDAADLGVQIADEQ